MVDSDGQLFTIEGIAASLILLLTAYIVVNGTSVYTPGDTHISNTQLEVTGSDALAMMNTAPDGLTTKTPLQTFVEQGDSAGFSSMFLNIINNRTGSKPDGIQFLANVTYVRNDNTINSTFLSNSSRSLYGGEHAVHVSQWIIVEKRIPEDALVRKRAELVEVTLWRD